MSRQKDGKKKIVVSGYYGYGNLGDDAILGMICRDLSDEYDLTVLSARPEETARIYGVKAIHRYRYFAVRRAVSEADLLLSGGGSLLQDLTSTRSLRYYLAVIRMARRACTPVMIYANGIGPILREKNRKRTAEVLRNADAVSVRDEDSAALLRELCPGMEAAVTADPVLRTVPAPEGTAERILDENGVPGKTAFAVFLRTVKTSDIPRIAALLDGTAWRTGLLPVFFSMQEPSDRAAAEAVRARMREPSLVMGRRLTASELVSVLAEMRGAVGMRFHALVLGAVAGVPLAGFDSDPKIGSFLRKIGSGKALLPLDTDPDKGADLLADVFLNAAPADVSGEIRESLKDPAMVREILSQRRGRFILHLISGGDTGGAKTHVLSLLRGLREQGTEVLLVCFTEGEFVRDAAAEGIPVRVLPRFGLIGNLRWLARLVRRHGADAVHSHGAMGNLYAALLHRMTGIPAVTTVHSDPDLDYMGRPAADRTYGAVNRRAVRDIPWHECVSEELKEKLTGYGIPEGNVFLIRNALPWEDPRPAVPREEWRRAHGIRTGDGTVVFGTAARLTPVKDVATMIRAFSAVAAKHPGARLVVAGDGEEAGKLKSLAAELCPAGTVLFTGWLTDTASFYGAVDVNVISSLNEGSPYALLEGGIMGCATAATAVGGIPDILEDGRNGLLFEPEDAETLAGHMERLLEDPGLRGRLGRALREKVAGEYTLEGTVRRQTEIYEEILSRAGKGRDGRK